MAGSSYPFTFDSHYPYPPAYPPPLAGGRLSNTRPPPGPSRSRLPPLHSSTFRQPFMPSIQDDAGSARAAPTPMTGDPDFDILEWLPAYQSCQRYFLDHAQHEQATQALCTLINIRLPFQHRTNATTTSTKYSSTTASSSTTTTTNNANGSDFNFSYPRANGNTTNQTQHPNPPPTVSLIPYLRRLVATNFDKPAILHGFFGDDYERGIIPHLECERRNYLFAAKSGGWEACKRMFDRGSGDEGTDESLPFLQPLGGVTEEELRTVEKLWGQWNEMMEWKTGAGKGKEREEVGRAVSGMTDAVSAAGGLGRDVGPRTSTEEFTTVSNADLLPDGVPQAFGEAEDKIG